MQDFQNWVSGLYTVATSGGAPELVTTFSGWGTPGAPAWTADDKKLIFSRPHFGPGDELDEITLADGSLRKLPFARNASWPIISAKGDKLAYVTQTSDGHDEIWRKDLQNPRVAGVRLISSTYVEQGQQYSPDGRHITFESTRGGVREIWMSDADGTHLVQFRISRIHAQ
jgi:Tol biopolymer transport system component